MRYIIAYFVVQSMLVQGACQFVSGATCQQGGADPVYRDTVTALLYRESTCASACSCSDAVDACAGCAYMSRYSESYCYNEFNCSTPCTPIPELPGYSKTLFWLFVCCLILLSVRKSRHAFSLAR